VFSFAAGNSLLIAFIKATSVLVHLSLHDLVVDADGWTMTPSGMCGVLNDAVSIYFLDAYTRKRVRVRWCAGYKIETAEGVFRVRMDKPMARATASLHRTP
jgi:hypothetical protein